MPDRRTPPRIHLLVDSVEDYHAAADAAQRAREAAHRAAAARAEPWRSWRRQSLLAACAFVAVFGLWLWWL